MDSVNVNASASAIPAEVLESALYVAFQAGQSARLALEPTTANPFSSFSELWFGWQTGWFLEESTALRHSIADMEAGFTALAASRRQPSSRCRSMWGIWEPRSSKWLFGTDGGLAMPSPLPLAAWLHQHPSYRRAVGPRVAKFPDDPTQAPTEFFSVEAEPETEPEAKGLEAHE